MMSQKTTRKASGAMERTGIFARITAWSFSRWSTYEGCPLRARYEYVEKRAVPCPNPKCGLPAKGDNCASCGQSLQGPAQLRGTAIHALAENYLNGRGALPKELKVFRDEYTELRKQRAKAEEQWAFSREWQDVDWFGSAAWCRIKVDAAALVGPAKRRTARIIDLKTGKQSAAHDAQLELYGLGALKRLGVEAVETELWYLDAGEIVAQNFDASMTASLEKTWAKRTKRMLSDTRYAPTPGVHCRWCPFSGKRGGPCSAG